MKRGYWVTGTTDGSGFAVVATSAKDAKQIAIASGEIPDEWDDLRVYWQKHAIVEDLLVGMVEDSYIGLVRGIYSYLEDAPCEECGNDHTLHGYNGRALCESCIDRIEHPCQQNAIIALLSQGPCTADKLPYHVGGMARNNRELIKSIRVCGKRTNTCVRCGKFVTVYYLEADIDKAIDLFVLVNSGALSKIDLRTNSMLDAGLSKDLAKRIKDKLRGG